MRLLLFSLALCLFAILLFGTSLIIRARDLRHLDLIASTTHHALCAFKEDKAREVASTKAFIYEIERGIRPMIPGISVSDLQRSLASQRSTLASLSDLNCS